MTLSEVVDRLANDSVPPRVMFQNNPGVTLSAQGDIGNTEELGVLEIVDTYYEKYIVAHTIDGCKYKTTASNSERYFSCSFCISTRFESIPNKVSQMIQICLLARWILERLFNKNYIRIYYYYYYYYNYYYKYYNYYYYYYYYYYYLFVFF